MADMPVATETVPVIPQVVDNNLSFAPADFANDMEKLAKAGGMVVDQPEKDISITSPTTPAQPQQAVVTNTEGATKTEVPEKFQKPDGTIDTEKLGKSIVNVDEALAGYLIKEKELKRKINEVRAQENAYINPPAPNVPAPVPDFQINTSFAQQLEADLAKEGAGVVLAKLFTAAQESVEERVQAKIAALQNVNAENTTRHQIEAIGKHDSWVFTKEGQDTLMKILNEQPYLMYAPDPYKAAYIQYSGLKSVESSRPSDSQVLTPTPQARPTAPVPPGQAVNQIPAQVINLESKEAIDNHLKKLTPDQQSEFFKRMGYPGF